GYERRRNAGRRRDARVRRRLGRSAAVRGQCLQGPLGPRVRAEPEADLRGHPMTVPGWSTRYAVPGAVLLSAAAVAAIGHWWSTRSSHGSPQERWAFIDRYCVDCHNRDDLTADIAFD